MISKNAKITDASIEQSEYGIVFRLWMTGSGFTSVCLGDTCLACVCPIDNINSEKCNYAGYYINKIFEVVDVDKLEELKGKPVRTIFKNKGDWGDDCIGIQHFINDEIFFIPEMYRSDEQIDISPILNDNLKSRFKTLDYDFLKITQNFNVEPSEIPTEETTNKNNIIAYVSPVLRIIEAALNGGDVDKCKRYAMKLAQYLEDDGYTRFASAIRGKFNPNANIIVFD